jgi:hypothetical protein
MTLAAPWALLLLSALPVLWWLSLPPRPHAARWTPHLAQVERALAALRRRPPRLSRLRFLLLALAVVAATLATARPQWRGAPGAERLVVVLDASASMAAAAAGERSPWSIATERLRRTLASVPQHVDVTLLRAGGELRRRHGASARALHDLGAPAGPLASDLAAVAAATAAEPGTAVWTLTDGQGTPRLPADGALSVVPRPGANAAVVAVRLADAWPLPQLSLAVDVVGFVDAPAAAVVHVRGAVVAAVTREVELVAAAEHTLEFAVERAAAGGALEVAIQLPGDVLAADDVYRAWLPPLPAPRIAVLEDAGDSGAFGALAARALAAEVGGEVVAGDAGARVGLLLVDGGRVALPAGSARALTFGCELPNASSAPVAWDRPAPLDWARTGELGRGLDLSELRIERAFRGLLPPGEPFLWASEDGRPEPLAVVAGTGDVASVHFAFRLADSNLPLLAAFPQLLRRAFVRCHGRGAAPVVVTTPPEPGELDLRQAAPASERPLPPFAPAPVDLSVACLLVGLLALACRCWVR